MSSPLHVSLQPKREEKREREREAAAASGQKIRFRFGLLSSYSYPSHPYTLHSLSLHTGIYTISYAVKKEYDVHTYDRLMHCSDESTTRFRLQPLLDQQPDLIIVHGILCDAFSRCSIRYQRQGTAFHVSQ